MMKIINRYFTLFLLVACVIGLIVPSFGENTSLIVILSLGFIIFCSYFQVELSWKSLTADFGLSAAFFLSRFVLLPKILFFAMKWISNVYALIVLLMFLAPAAVSSPSFTQLFGGKTDLSLKILIFSSFLSILTIPYIPSLLLGTSVSIPAKDMLLTLLYTIVVPFILHLPLRRFMALKTALVRWGSLMTLLGLSIMFIVVTARNKVTMVQHPELVGLFIAISLAIYAFMYLFGYFFMPSGAEEKRRTLSISSGANNVGLAVAITTLFFPGTVNVFFIVSQLTWVAALIPMRRWLWNAAPKDKNRA